MSGVFEGVAGLGGDFLGCGACSFLLLLPQLLSLVTLSSLFFLPCPEESSAAHAPRPLSLSRSEKLAPHTRPRMLPPAAAAPATRPLPVAVVVVARPARAARLSAACARPAATPTPAARRRPRTAAIWASPSGDMSDSNPLTPLASVSSSSSSADEPASSASDAAASSSTSPPLPGVKIDLGLPRRSRRVSFTCNKCGECRRVEKPAFSIGPARRGTRNLPPSLTLLPSPLPLVIIIKPDTRTDRMVNPRAWESGMVFVQCGDPACGAWHKVADAAGLVEEINFAAERAELVAAAALHATLEFEGGDEPHALVPVGDRGAIVVTSHPVEVEEEE